MFEGQKGGWMNAKKEDSEKTAAGRCASSTWWRRLIGRLVSFVKGMLFLLLGLCAGLIALLFLPSRSWGRLDKGERIVALRELSEHFRPMVNALHRYEAEQGSSPVRLSHLVPKYMDRLPVLEPKHVDQFSYYPSWGPDIREQGTICNKLIWYEGSTFSAQTAHDWPIERFEDHRHRHSLMLLDDQGRVQSMRTYSSELAPQVISMGPGPQQAGHRAGSAHFEERLRELVPTGQRLHVLKRQLGSGKAERELPRPWVLVVWLPEFLFDLDADSFIYSSKDRTSGEGDGYGGWTFSVSLRYSGLDAGSLLRVPTFLRSIGGRRCPP